MRLLQRRFRIRTQLLALFSLLLGTGFFVLVTDELALQDEISTFDALLHDSLSGLRLAKSISDSYRLEIVDTTFRVRNNLTGWDQGLRIVDVARSDIQRDWQALIETNLSPEQRVLADEIAKVRMIADAATDNLVSILKKQDMKELGRFADTDLFPAMDPVTTRLQFLADVKMLDAEREVKDHLMHARAIGWLRILISIAALLLVIVVGRGVLRNVYKGIGHLVHLARHVRDPDFVLPAQGFGAAGNELGQINDALVAMRSDLLTYEKDLLESEARATAANKAKSSFLASMSHEIRTPMVGVAGMLELLAHTKLDTDQRQQIEIAQNSAQSLLQIIGDILDFSKIEAGKLELNPAPLDLRALVGAAVNNFLGTASAKGLRLECHLDARVAPAHFGDALRMRQILSNFLSNALKFTERGDVQVILDRLASEDQRELIALRVKDSGIGISAEDQALLFQPFAQVDGGGQRADSTGLGLTICRRLAEMMGGEIVMESRFGVGTTMSLIVRLPLADPAMLARAESTVSAPMRAAPSVAEAEREGSLILFADDHPTNRAVIARQLNQLGYACETAHDGESALQMWKSGRHALVLTDLHMPKRDGYSLAAAIRADERASQCPRTPIIAVSANVSIEEIERSRTVGIDDFIAKPTPLALLATTLDRYLPLQKFAADALANPAAAPIAAPAIDSGLDAALIADFLSATRDDIDALRKALTANDAAGVMREAHRIKGASGLVGATALCAAASAIEAAGRSADLAIARAKLAELDAAVKQFADSSGVAIA